MQTSIQEIIKNHILGEIFTEFPTNLNQCAFQFFLEADVDCAEDVSMSPLGKEWGYDVCQAYELDNIRAIRGLMQSMYSDLEKLKTSLFDIADEELEDLAYENKQMAETLSSMGISQDKISTICSGSSMFQVYIISNNDLVALHQTLTKEEAEEFYLQYANEYYRFDGTFKSIDEVESYKNSEQFYNDANEVNIVMEMM